MNAGSVDAGRITTVGDELARATRILAAAGVASPRLDAGLLMAFALGVDRTALWLSPERILAPAEYDRWQDFLQRRAHREPVAYITGQKEFFGRVFQVTPEVLVPRPETEILVQAVLETLPAGERLLVADVGTGSGVVAVTLACERPCYYVLASDISPAACDVAAKNARWHGVAERVYVFAGPLLGPVADFWPLDAVVANLPYVPTGEIPALAPEIAGYEPIVALDGGPDGLTLVRRLSEQAVGALRPGGLLALEVGQGQAKRVEAMLRGLGYESIEVRPDLAGIPRVVMARRGDEAGGSDEGHHGTGMTYEDQGSQG